MTFLNEISLPASYKICLVEIDIPIDFGTTAINYSPGIWRYTMNPDFGIDGTVTVTDDDGLTGWFEYSGDVAYKRIGGLRVDADVYEQQTSLTDCIAQEMSFYYDATEYALYIHFDDFAPPLGKPIRFGEINGFSDRVGTTGAYFDDIYYDPRVINLPSLRKAKDPLFYGIAQYTGGSVSFINSDGYFDDFVSKDIYGQPVRVYFGFDGLAFSDFRLVFTGFIEDFKYTWDTFTLNIQDQRKTLSRKLPVNTFSKSIYPNLADDKSGAPKPLSWGPCRNIPVICLNELDTTASSFDFYLADETYRAVATLDAVYLDGIEITPTPTLVSGGFSIASGVYVTTPGGDTLYIEDNLDAVTANINQASTVLGLDIIKEILLNYGDVQYIANNYNLGEWSDATALSRPMAIYIDEKIELKELIEKICVSDDGVFLVQSDGKYSFRKFNENRVPRYTIQTDEWISEPEITYNSAEYLTSVRIKYNKNFESGDFMTYNNTAYEDDVYRRYKVYKDKEFETFIALAADANAKSEVIMDRSKEVLPTITRKTKTQYILMEIMDFVNAEHSRPSATTKSWATYEVIGIDKNINTMEVSLTLKYVKDYTPPEYSVSEGDIHLEVLCGEHLFGPTEYVEV